MELPLVSRRLGVIIGTLIVLASSEADAGIGRTPGFAAVSRDGEAEYTIPLALPPGTNGMTPVVTLEYRHRTRSGLLGIGWSIGGLSQISRCPRTVAQDGIAIWPNHNSNDRFCLDGQRLVALDILAYGASSGEYRTEIESYARIRAHPGTGNGPGHFVVEAADGRIYEYGATADSRIDRSAGVTMAGATVWALNRIRDRSGNVIDYSYFEDTSNGSFRIASIRYNSNPAAGVAASHQISFVYVNRPSNEIDTGYVAGSPVRQIVRLHRIDIFYNSAVLRRYELNYEPALSAGGRSQLASVRECGLGGSDCLAPTTLVWQNATPGFAAATVVTATPSPTTSTDLWKMIDINGDGRLDYLWAGGNAMSSATIRYRLGTAAGFGPEVNSGVPCPRGLGRTFDSNGDGRADLLMAAPSGQFAIVTGRDTGLAAPMTTGIAVPAGMKDFRGLDFNGDGLGDIAWSESVGPAGADNLFVRARNQLRTGGYQAPATLYSQSESTGYTEARGGKFMGREGRVDLNGDGAEDLFMNEEVSIVRISAVGRGAELFDGGYFHGGVVLDINDDGCADFAYKHGTGTLRVRVNFCGVGGSTTELLGPAWTGAAVLRAHDWNGDGRDDVLMSGPTNWQVAVSKGDSLAAIVDTGVPHEGAPWITGLDVDGDGLQDLVTRVANQFRLRRKNGAPPDLLLSVKDGFGLSAEFRYGPLTNAAVHTRGTSAVYPDQDMQTSAQVVTRFTATDGSGRGWKSATGYRYEGLRRNLHGRGLLGFRKQTLTDLTSGRMLSAEITRRQDFPFTGLPESIVVRQNSGKPVSHASYQWSKLDLGGRRFPYPATTTSRRYEAGGAHDGVEIARVVRSIAAIDATSGLVTDETTTVTEIAGGANAGSSASYRAQRSAVLNDTANWCLGRPQSIQVTASHTLAGGAAIARRAGESWDGLKCRPTQRRLEPGDSQWQVTYDLAYDAFGNLASEKVTGAGMPARTMAINWGTSGQFPIRWSNPLSQLSRMSWDAAIGLPLTFTDPNGLTTRWNYDVFGRPERETLPDGTSTTWTREGCKSGCDARAKYRIVQEDRDTTGAVRVSSSVEVDQNERGFRLRSPQPGGGRSVSTVDRDDRGQILRRYLPHWDGGSPSGHWLFTYDVLGRPTGAQLRGTGGTIERSIAIEYDGFAVTQRNPLGHAATGIRTAWSRLFEIVDATGSTTRYEHDAFGNLLRVRDALNNTVSTIGYNRRGMKLAHSDIDMGAWTWTRNALGETTALRDAKGQILGFEYDPLGRVTKRTALDGTATWTWGNTAAKKDIGRLTGVAGPGYSEGLTYDGVGRPATRTIVTDASYRFDYGYNSLGLLDSITYPAAGAGSAFRLWHNYDAGRLSVIRNGSPPGESYWTLNAVDASGNPLDESLGSAVRVINGFDSVTGVLEYRQSGLGGGPAIQNLAYNWDANGNLSSRADLNQNITEAFRYDALDRLKEARRNGVLNLEMDYDAIGNIRRKSDVCAGTTTCYIYHPQRKHAVSKAGSQSYAYDANGNMTSRGGAAIAWTSRNLPSSIAHSNGNSSQFSYGPDGNRWKQVAKHGAATETTIYSGGLMEKVTRGGVTTWRHYVLAPTGTAAVQLRYSGGSPSVMRYLTQDHLGSIDRIVDAGGNVVVAESFAPFGRRRGSNWLGVPSATELAKIAAVTRDGFTGHEHLDNLDLIHMNGRVQDPHLGRFISADPYVTRPYDGQGLNRYAYTLNNPLAFTDPSGFDPPCVESSPDTCAQVTVVGVEWADWIRYLGGGVGQVASARERDPCGQESDAYTCAFQGRQFVSPARIVLTVGSRPDPTLSRSRLDFLQGAVARVANLTISSSPVAMLFGADPDFEWFDVPDSDGGQTGANLGNVGYLVGGFGGIIRKGGSEVVGSAPSAIARSFQGNKKYPGIDRFKDITLKKGTIIYAGFPGQTAFYTTASALRRSGNGAEYLFRGLQLQKHRDLGYRSRVAAYEVMADTPASFGLAIANIDHGAGWLPQVVVPSFQTSLRFLEEIPLGP
ncbi:MAG: RHS repeat-associated core domain-containing protein [Steroidobacteraceae bacterium]